MLHAPVVACGPCRQIFLAFLRLGVCCARSLPTALFVAIGAHVHLLRSSRSLASLVLTPAKTNVTVCVPACKIAQEAVVAEPGRSATLSRLSMRCGLRDSARVAPGEADDKALQRHTPRVALSPAPPSFPPPPGSLRLSDHQGRQDQGLAPRKCARDPPPSLSPLALRHSSLASSRPAATAPHRAHARRPPSPAQPHPALRKQP